MSATEVANPPRAPTPGPPLGLCGGCAFRHRVTSARGSRFLLCLRSREDPRFPRYPNLPVLECAGHRAGDPPD